MKLFQVASEAAPGGIIKAEHIDALVSKSLDDSIITVGQNGMYSDIKEAYDSATAGQLVWVSPGEYTLNETIVLKSNVDIYFAPDAKVYGTTGGIAHGVFFTDNASSVTANIYGYGKFLKPLEWQYISNPSSAQELLGLSGLTSHVQISGIETNLSGYSGGLPTYSQSISGVEVFNLYKYASTPTFTRRYNYGRNSHVEGYGTKAFGDASHAEGGLSNAYGLVSHSEGNSTSAIGDYSHSEGSSTSAVGSASHAEGVGSIASGATSHAQNGFTIAQGTYQTAIGGYNVAQGGVPTLTSDSIFIIGNGSTTSARGDAFRVTWAGNATCDGAFTGGGADYAESFEWEDGNPDNDDRVGYFVELSNEDQIKLFETEGDEPLGIISGRPAVIGDEGANRWVNKYVTDDWGRIQYETIDLTNEEGEVIRAGEVAKVNPDFDPNVEYTPRLQRKEWDAVGLLGKLRVRDDGTCQVNGWCKPVSGGTATKTTKTANVKYKVLKRITDNIILVLFK